MACAAVCCSRLCFAYAAICKGATAGDFVFSTSSSIVGSTTNLLVYSKGKLKGQSSVDLPEGAFKPGSVLGISGNAQFAFIGAGVNFGVTGNTSTFAIFRIAGPGATNTPKLLGKFVVEGALALDNNQQLAPASVDAASGDGFVFVTERIIGSCDGTQGLGVGVRFIELRFSEGCKGVKSTLKLGRTWEAYKSTKCGVQNVIGMQPIGDKLYVVARENALALIMRSFDAFAKKPTASPPIVSYPNTSGEMGIVLSPKSFAVYVLNSFYAQDSYIGAIKKGGKPVKSRHLPDGQQLGNNIVAYPDGSGILAGQGTLITQDNSAAMNAPVSIVRYNATTLATLDTVLVIPAMDSVDVDVRGFKIVPKPRKA